VRRDHELAVRAALGAARRTLVRQLLFEGAILALLGSAAGLVLAAWGIDALRTAVTTLPRAAELRVDFRLVTFTLLLGVGTTMLFALVPALQATGFDVARRLTQGARTQLGGRQLLQRALVTSQIALAVVLLVGAGLLIRSFERLQQVSPGFDPTNVLTFRVSATWSESGRAAVAVRQGRTLERLRAIPGVESAAFETVLPASLDADYPPSEFTIPGRGPGEHIFAVQHQVSAALFSLLRIPMRQGGTCRDEFRPEAPQQVVVSQSFADRFFPGVNPVGRHLTTPQLQAAKVADAEIVGTVADVRAQSLTKEPQPSFYWCGLSQFYPDPYYLVRIDPSRGVTMTAIREALREIEPRRAVYAAYPLEDVMAVTTSQPRLNTILLASFAAMALVLAGIGLYGILTQLVARKRREIGLRVALGAGRTQVVSEIVRHAAAVTCIGLGTGLVAAGALSRFMTSMVFGITTRDPMTFVAVPLLLAAIALVATVVPATRAARVDPMQALRTE
jgi:putative ABC transport system permease protein